MYRMHRTFRPKRDRVGEGRAYLSEVSAYLAKKYNVRCEVFLEVFGPATTTCHLMIDFENLTAFEKFWLQLGTDAEFGAIQNQEIEISIEGSVTQSLLHSHA